MHRGQGGVGVDSKWGCLVSPNLPPQRVLRRAKTSRGSRRGSSLWALRHGLSGGQEGGSRCPGQEEEPLPPLQGLMQSCVCVWWGAGVICPHLAPVAGAVGSQKPDDSLVTAVR